MMRTKLNDHTVGFVLISFLYILSLVVRLPRLGLPLSDHHEYVTAHTLIALENLDSYGPKYWFHNIQTYPGKANRFIPWATTRSFDKNGIGYYTSYPPLALILLFFVFKILSLDFSVLNLQTFNIFLHLMSAWFVYKVVYSFLAEDHKLISAVGAATLHLFLFPNLWFYSTTYSWDTLWYYILVIEIYLFLKLIGNTNNHKNKQNIFFLGIGVFLGTFTEYQNIFFSLVILLWSFLHRKTHPHSFQIAITTAFAAGLALLINTIQMASINGLIDYFSSLVNRFIYVYGTFGQGCLSCSLRKIFSTSYDYFAYVWPLIIVFLISAIINPPTTKKLLKETATKWATLCIIIPYLLHVVFMATDVAEHEFDNLKLSLLISFLGGLLPSFKGPKTKTKRYLFGPFYGLVLASVVFLSCYKYAAFFPEPDSMETLKYYSLGTEMGVLLKKDEVGFAITECPIYPQTVYYIKRNILKIESEEKAKDWLKTIKINNGKVFRINKECLIDEVFNINI